MAYSQAVRQPRNGRFKGSLKNKKKLAPEIGKKRENQVPKYEKDSSQSSDDDSENNDEDNDEEANDSLKNSNKNYNLLLKSLIPENPTPKADERRTKRRKIDHSNGSSHQPAIITEDSTSKRKPGSELNGSAHLTKANRQKYEGEDDDDNDEDDVSAEHPFDIHFEDTYNEKSLLSRIEAISNDRWEIEKFEVPTKLYFTHPAAPKESAPYLPTLHNLSKFSSPTDVNLKKRLLNAALKLMPTFEQPQIQLSSPLFNYCDLLYGGRTTQNAESIRNITCLHVLNHVFKTRDRVIKNNTRAAQKLDCEYRDQGFTRPKILFLLETRQSCVRYMNTIASLCEPEQQENYKRFQDAFVRVDDNSAEGKPLDFQELFEGNDDNEFRLGVKFTRKTLKYYSKFYNSDIIIASPLGLRRAIKADDPKNMDYDFLSSIEILVIDQADAMLMQNWEHVEFALDHLNRQPKESHGCDFSRVRQWYLHQQAKYLRQTIVLSAYITPELNSLFNSHMLNAAGKFRYAQNYEGSMLDVGLQIRQTFCRFNSSSPASEPDDRFKYFTAAIIPTLVRHIEANPDGQVGILIFIPSYLDYVRVRNYFTSSPATQNILFGSVHEYGEQKELSRARSHFITGRHSVLLYTGRAHHFRRYNIRGVKQVIWYGIPENPIFYPELVGGFLGLSITNGEVHPTEASAKAMFSVWDSLSLERIVGTERAGRMLKERGGDMFDFR